MNVPATYLGFDDTDSPDGMCTTYLATLMLGALSEFDLLGLPRLVRLNPNVPWKTRGNAAICLPLGHGAGHGSLCGEVLGRPVKWYREGTPADEGQILPTASSVLEQVAEFECENTNPGLVVSRDHLPQRLYWAAARGVLGMPEVEGVLKAAGASWRKYKNGRGIIGAASSISWRPHDRTWEVIAYRHPDRVGTPRDVDEVSVVAMDEATEHTFHNYDHENKHVAICPASPCPVLFGIRGDDPEELLEARKMIRGEPSESWLLFMTNQGTDDHIRRSRIGALAPGGAARVRATVATPPKTVKGGHTIVRISDGDEVDVAFYEPSGRLNRAAKQLLPGDEVEVFGSVRDVPRSLNAEKLFVSSLARVQVKRANPLCPGCRKRMGSMGRGQGYRCKVCGARASASGAETVEAKRGIRPGWYEPPISSRRHLYKPVRRMPRENINNLL